MYKKFHESARRQTWGADLCANEFDHNLWGPLFKRVNFECRNSGERKLKRPALNLGVQFEYLNEVKNTKKAVTKDDVEIVYPNWMEMVGKRQTPSMLLCLISSQTFLVLARTRLLKMEVSSNS